MKPDYIFIDDDRTNNILCKMILHIFDSSASAEFFSEPLKGIEFINLLAEDLKFKPLKNTILFLDVNMPIMTGWDFLDEFEKLDEEFKNTFSIYILTSAIEDFKKEKKRYPFVKGFQSKPLRVGDLEEITEQVQV